MVWDTFCKSLQVDTAGPTQKGSIWDNNGFVFEILTDYVFLYFLFRLKDLLILDCRFGFSKPDYIYYQLGRSGGQECGENPTS